MSNSDNASSELRSAPPLQLYAIFSRRLKAAALDVLILAAFLLAGAGLAAWVEPSLEVAHAGLIAWLAALMFYEPVLVSLHGRTLGHRALNIHVVANTPSGRLPLWKAFLRSSLELLTGVSTPATMPFTRRNQALHDLAFGKTVCIFDRHRARIGHFVSERAPVQSHGQMPSRLRRLLVSLCYLLLLFVAQALALVASLSIDCVELDPVFEAAVLDVLERAEEDRGSERNVRRSEREQEQAEARAAAGRRLKQPGRRRAAGQRPGRGVAARMTATLDPV